MNLSFKGLIGQKDQAKQSTLEYRSQQALGANASQ